MTGLMFRQAPVLLKSMEPTDIGIRGTSFSDLKTIF
jgi:hypothetical protein